MYKHIELHLISKEPLVVLVITLASFCYHVSSNGFTSCISLAGVFLWKGRERQEKKEDISQYFVINPVGVTAFSGILARKLRTLLCLGEK